jgi:hypothetical protein
VPTRASQVPKYCLHKPSGQGYVRIRNRVVYCGKFGTPDSLAEYGRLIGALVTEKATESARSAAGAKIADPPRKPATIEKLFRHYQRFAKTYYRKKDGTVTLTAANIERALQRVQDLYGRAIARGIAKANKQIAETAEAAGVCACKCVKSIRCKSLSRLGLNFVTESNCVLARGGGEQLEVNCWSVG